MVATEADGKLLVGSEVRFMAYEAGEDAGVKPVGAHEKGACCGRGVGEVGRDRSICVVCGDKGEGF